MKNKYFFKSDTRLTNYYICNVEVDGVIYPSSEAAYHAQKFFDEDIKKIMIKDFKKSQKTCSK